VASDEELNLLESIKAVGFDLDNTLLRTHVDYSKIDRADRDVCESHGIPFDVLGFGAHPRLRAPIRDWLASNGRADEFAAVSADIDAILTATELEHVGEATPFLGTKECLDSLKAKGFKLGILSRGSENYVKQALTITGFIDYFDAIAGRDTLDYDDAKPSPKAMYKLAKLLHVDPSEILYVGDNVTDYYSARDAGARFVGVLTGSTTAQRWMELDPDMIVVEKASDIIRLT
jgi:HAD superfamily hydrolase (TIGR01549 family)